MMISRQAIRLFSRGVMVTGTGSSVAGFPSMSSWSTTAAAAAATTSTYPASSSLYSHTRFFSSESNGKKTEEASSGAAGATTETDGQGGGAAAPAAADERGDDATQQDATEDPSQEIEKLNAEVKSLKDQLLRSYAEQENTRNIAKRDIAEARQFAIKSFAKSLLEVSDNLQRALDSVNQDEVGSNASLKSLQEGILMTQSGLSKALQANGLEAYCQEPGDKFDPSLHNALMQYPDPSREDNTVGQVIKVGYKLHQRVLRPAEVGVVKNA